MIDSAVSGLVFGLCAGFAWFLTQRLLWFASKGTRTHELAVRRLTKEVADEMQRRGLVVRKDEAA